ncbi:GNAT family N-acetyltransferase [Vibrio pectenicida]|uniref:GNAT family N-acetyltransferase n=1 Tax=Vibrio pectenicida TaxID=62763 RepID=UPI003B9A1526
MKLRKATIDELDSIYAMGFDVWGDGLPFQEYLSHCRQSKKYQSGIWYVLTEQETVISSLIVYQDMFNLKQDCFGIGSVATSPSHRQKGYASKLINLVKAKLFEEQHCKTLYLHSDINHKFYKKLGFTRILDSNCMLCSNDESLFSSPIPYYF